MNTDMNNEEYPRLTPPEVVYEHKDALKRKSAVIVPLWVKVTSAAAAVALLFGIFWQRPTSSPQELVATLEPIPARVIAMDREGIGLRSTSVSRWQRDYKVGGDSPKTDVQAAQPSADVTTMSEEEQVAVVDLLAELQPIEPQLLASAYTPSQMAPCDLYCEAEYDTDLEEMTFIRQGIYAITDGEHDSFYSLFAEGLRNVKIELASAAVTIRSSRYQLQQKVR